MHIDRIDSCKGAGETLYLINDIKSRELPKEHIDRLKLLYTMLWSGGSRFNELLRSNKEYKELLAKKNKNKKEREEMKQTKKNDRRFEK